MKISVVLVALNEAEFIQPCIKAIYPFVDRIKIQTNYDRSWSRKIVTPDKTVEKILEIPDGLGKIELYITRIPDEAIARNWMMRSATYKLDHPHHSTTSTQNEIDNFFEQPDYFWIVDGDEIYDPETVPNILNYLKVKNPQVLKIRGISYFKSWNYQVSPSDHFYQPGFIKPKVWFRENRNFCFPSGWRSVKRLIQNKYWSLNNSFSEGIESRIGILNLPEDIGVFHHASYVGNDSRILKKISCSGHYDIKMDLWYENIWKKWTPEIKDLHPLNPEVFPGVRYVPSWQLPCSIRDEIWPDDYLEKTTLKRA